jgi:hypothetical protein
MLPGPVPGSGFPGGLKGCQTDYYDKEDDIIQELHSDRWERSLRPESGIQADPIFAGSIDT